MKTYSLLFLAGLFLAGCSKSPEVPQTGAELAAARVRVQPVELKERQATEEVVGTVRAKLRATLEAKVSGRIEQMPVTLGQAVSTGDLIAKLDAPEIQAKLDQAKAGFEQTERDWKRISSLFEQQAVTHSEYDAAQGRYRQAAASVAEAQAMVAYVQVLAPFNGVITKRWVDVGDLAVPGKPLVDIEDPAALQLEADVPEAIAAHIRRDAPMTVRVDAVGDDLSGLVAEIAPSADAVSRTFRVKLDLSKSPGLMPGQFGRLLVPVGEDKTMRVPAGAIIERGQLEIAFVVANQRAQLHLVKSGKHFGQEVEVLAGLDVGEPVVVEGADQLVDGQPVQVQ